VKAGATLAGFTLENGATDVDGFGGGAYCQWTSMVSNCVLSGNSTAIGGGAAGYGTLKQCTLIGNIASQNGGGANWTTLIDCLVVSNSAANLGGGAAQGQLINCTVVGNSASQGGGFYATASANTILFYNSATNGANYVSDSQTLYNCCTIPLPSYGTGNITNEPVFVDFAAGDFHLQSTSPCIDAGNNSYTSNLEDLDGQPRIVNGTVDMGAFEFQGFRINLNPGAKASGKTIR